jgi:hypothetical protein
MGPRVAILGYLDDPALPPGRPPFEEHLDLCQSTTEFLNAAAWDDPFTELLAGPGVVSVSAWQPRPLTTQPDGRTLMYAGVGRKA